MNLDRVALSGWDWGVILIYGIGMLLIGYYYSRKNKNSEDYMLGGRNMKSWKVGVSLFATMFSSVTYLSFPGEMIKNGPMILSMVAALPVVYFIVAYYFIPFIMKLKITSAYELLEKKLGLGNRLLASSFFLFMRLIWMSVIIFMVADKIIIPLMGWSEDKALMISIVMGIVTVIYTSSGGLRSVVITDVIQSFILLLGTVLAIALIMGQLNNVTDIIPNEWPKQWAGWTFYDPSARVSFLAAFITSFGWYICTAGSDQMAIQRYLATKDIKAARKMYLGSIVVGVIVDILLGILALALFAYFSLHSELFSNGSSIIEGADLLFPRFIVIGLPVGFSGLVLAGLLAASMSSLSSGVNSSALSIINDFVVRLRKDPISDSQQVKMAKIISLGIGVIIVSLSLVIGNIQGNLLELTFKTINVLVAPLFIPFFMAMFIRIAKPKATFIGTTLSAVSAILVSFSNEIFGTGISFLWIIPLSFLVGAVVSIGLSLLPFEKVCAESK